MINMKQSVRKYIITPYPEYLIDEQTGAKFKYYAKSYIAVDNQLYLYYESNAPTRPLRFAQVFDDGTVRLLTQAEDDEFSNKHLITNQEFEELMTDFIAGDIR